jgi:hypothetical protein
MSNNEMGEGRRKVINGVIELAGGIRRKSEVSEREGETIDFVIEVSTKSNESERGRESVNWLIE